MTIEELIIDVIRSMKHVEQLVTFALRKHGFVNGTWSVEYHNDDEDVPKGSIQIYNIHEANGYLINEQIYLEILAEICEKDGYKERSTLLYKLIKNPNITDDLLEANPNRCNERWKQFAPFLIENGWKMENDCISFSATNEFYNLTYCTDDLDVLYRKLSKEKSDSASTKSQLKVLESFFYHEKKTKIF